MYEAFKPLGILSISIGWASMLFLILKWRGEKSMSFSRHAAAHRSAYVTMVIMESIFLPMYFIFIATWFTHTFQLPFIFTILNGIASFGLLIAAWVPEKPGISGKIHRGVGYPAFLCMPPIALFIATSDSVGSFARAYSLLAFITMVACGIYLVFKTGNKENKFLYAEGLFLASIHSAILIATYIR